MGYKFRKLKQIRPRTFTDFAACSLLCCAIPTVFWFEIFVVMPSVFNHIIHTIHIFLGAFVLANILGNFFAIIFIDTSTKGVIMPASVPRGWHVCAPCESVAPPRSRHCGICGVCVLKREHHCIFTGCCVGLSNHRYFFIFLAYMWISTFYCSFVNAFFISPYISEDTILWTIIRIILPGLWLIMNPSMHTIYGFLFSLNVIGCLFLSVLLYYYGRQVLTNTTTRERTEEPNLTYDKGTMHNIEVVLGKRWYLTWLSPFVMSTLTYDGLDWKNKLLCPLKNTKSK